MRTCDPKRGLQILEAAAQLFASHRYHEVRMEDIAAQAGVAKGTIYRYFHDKEELYLALTMLGMHRLLEESQGKVAGDGKPETKLLDFITHIFRFYEKYPYFLELIQRMETSGSEVSTNALQSIRTQFFHLVINLITQLNDAEKKNHTSFRVGSSRTHGHYTRNTAFYSTAMAKSFARLDFQSIHAWPEHLQHRVFANSARRISAE